MEEAILHYLSKLDIASIIAMVALFWWFNGKMEQRFEKIETEFRAEFKDIRADLKELRTSANRMEGAFMSKDCCILKDDRQIKKAE